MADMDSLIVTFQTQLSDVMETVVKTAMYEVTRLVEDGLMLELKARGQEVERLKLQLQRTEKQLSDQRATQAERTEECEAMEEEEEKKRDPHTESTKGGHNVDDANSSRHVSKSGPTHEQETTAASFSPVWKPQAQAEDPVRLIDNIKVEEIEPVTCPLNLEEWRVTLSEVQSECQNTSARKEDNELLRHIVQQNVDSKISATYVVSYGQDTINESTHSNALDKNTNWLKMASMASEEDCEAKHLQPTNTGLTKLETNSKVTPGSPSSSCNVFGVTIKQEVNVDSEQLQTHTVNKAMSHSFIRTGTPKQNRLPLRSFLQVGKLAKGSSSFRSNLLQRPIKRPPALQTNSSTAPVSIAHSQGVSSAPAPLSLSVQRAHLGDKHVPWVNIKQSSSSLSHTNPALNPNSSLNGSRPIFRCGQCGKCFPHPSNLKSHMLTHTGERPFCCSLCGRTFTKLSNLKAHRRVHTGERPYICVSCGKRFTQNCNLKRHQRTHLDGQHA